MKPRCRHNDKQLLVLGLSAGDQHQVERAGDICLICCGLSICVPQIHMSKPSSQCDGLQKWGLWEVKSWGWSLHEWDQCPYKKRLKKDGFSLPSSANQEESSHQTSDLLAPWSWISQPPELWEISVCCLSHSVYGIPLEQPELRHRCACSSGDHMSCDGLNGAAVKSL